MEDVLVAENLRKVYDDGTTALRDVSLSVGSGEVFALIGPNGAGKTTFVRSLTGTTELTEGNVRLLGASPKEMDKSRLGLLPQNFSPPDRLTARELIEYYAGLYDDARDPDEVLSEVGIPDASADTWYAHLSGGQQRRVCVGATLVNDPDVLFLDEPTTGVDPQGRRDLWRLFEDLTAGGTTIFLTTHYMAEAEQLADRVGLLSDGELVKIDTPNELIVEYGGDNRLEIETDATAADVNGTPFTVEETGSGLVFQDIEPADIGDAVRLLDERGIEYEALTWTQPDLEDVYLHLTGESFESEEQTTPVAPEVAAGGETR